MDITQAAKTVLLEKYARFSGRAIRSEYWWFVLFSIIVSIVLTIVDSVLGIQILSPIWSLAVLIPSIAVGVRRLHDLDKSGWFLLLGLIPLIGAIILIYWFAQPGTPGDNQYGPAAVI